MIFLSHKEYLDARAMARDMTQKGETFKKFGQFGIRLVPRATPIPEDEEHSKRIVDPYNSFDVYVVSCGAEGEPRGGGPEHA